MTISDQVMTLSSASSEVRSIKDVLKNRTEKYNFDAMTIRRYASEVQKKFTLSAACIALFLIGAPLGAIIRKGGLGLPVVISVVFFLISSEFKFWNFSGNPTFSSVLMVSIKLC